jgi:hypothetical protein
MKTPRSWPLFVLASLAALATLSPARAEAPATFKVGEVTFTRPVSWEWVEPASPMRKAQLSVKDKSGQGNADVIFFYFGAGSGGGTKSNVDRWLGQFEEPREKINAKVEETTVGKTKVTYVQAEGTYKSGMPGGQLTPMPGTGLVGAIVEAADGSIFVRMTGPKELVKSSVSDFKKMIESGLK